MKSTIIFVETNSQVTWAISYFKKKNIKNFYPNILPTSEEAQISLIKSGSSYDHYINLHPSKKTKEYFLKLADQVAKYWVYDKRIREGLTIKGVHLGLFLMAHWQIFLPQVLISNHILNEAIRKYKPGKIIYFDKVWRLDNISTGASLETLLLDQSSNELINSTAQKIKLERIDLVEKSLLPKSLYWFNLYKYFSFLIQSPLNIFLMIPYAGQVFFSKKKRIFEKDVLVFADKHILADAVYLLKNLKLKGLRMNIVGTYLLLSHKLILFKNSLDYIDLDKVKSTKSGSAMKDAAITFWEDFRAGADFEKFLNENNLFEIAPIIKSKLDAFFNFGLDPILKHYFKAERIIKDARPKKIFLFGNFGSKSLSFAISGKNSGAVICVIQHGITSAPRSIYTPTYDNLLVWSSIEKELYHRNFGLPKDKMSVVGWHYVDHLIEPSEKYRDKLLRNLSLKKEPRILFLTVTNDIDHPLQIKTLLESIKAVGEIDGSKLVIRPHPDQFFPRDISSSIPKNKRPEIKWSLGEDLDRQIRMSDIVITQGTTAGLRAMFWGKPTIHLAPYDVLDIAQFSKFGASIKVKKMEKLVPSIKALMQSKGTNQKITKGQSRLLGEYTGNFDKNTAMRIYNILK